MHEIDYCRTSQWLTAKQPVEDCLQKTYIHIFHFAFVHSVPCYASLCSANVRYNLYHVSARVQLWFASPVPVARPFSSKRIAWISPIVQLHRTEYGASICKSVSSQFTLPCHAMQRFSSERKTKQQRIASSEIQFIHFVFLFMFILFIHRTSKLFRPFFYQQQAEKKKTTTTSTWTKSFSIIWRLSTAIMMIHRIFIWHMQQRVPLSVGWWLLAKCCVCCCCTRAFNFGQICTWQL